MRTTFLVISIIFLAACSARPYIVKPIRSEEKLDSVQVYVVSHGWHTGFVVPAQFSMSHFPKLRDRFINTPFIEFGWGDKGFYQATEITSGLTLQAIFWPTESVMHVVAVPQKIQHYFPNSEIVELCLSSDQYAALVRFIENSFYKDEAGEIQALHAGIYGDSQFYKGEGNYYLMNTCNKWTAKGLASAGLDIDPTFKLTAGGVMSYLETWQQSQIATRARCH